MAFLNQTDLEKLNFKSLGKNVKVSTLCSIYGAENMEIGDNSRIDDFCVISAGTDGITLGKHVHVACFSLIIGRAKITLGDFAGLSSRVTIYSSTDDYSGNYLTNPTIPSKFLNILSAPVSLGRHVIIGTNSTVLPGVTIEDGTAVGAHSLVNKSLAKDKIAYGIPAKIHSERQTNFYALEQELINGKK